MDRKTFIKLLGGSGLGISLMGLGVYTPEIAPAFRTASKPTFFKLALVQKSKGLLKFLNFAKGLKPYGLNGLIYCASLLSPETDWDTLKQSVATAGLKNLGLRIEGPKIELEVYFKWLEVAQIIDCQFVQLSLDKSEDLQYLVGRAKDFDIVVQNTHSKSTNLIRQIDSAKCGLATSLSELSQRPQQINLAKVVYLTSACHNLSRVNYCKSLQILKSSGYRDYLAIDSYTESNLREIRRTLDLMRRHSAELI